MSQALTPAIQVSARRVVTRIRELPVAGDIIPAVGDTVTASQIVARAFLPGDLHILRLPEKLGLQPAEVMRGLKIKEGDAVAAGDLLCEHIGLFGLFRSRFESPVGGLIELVSVRTGHVGVRTEPRPISVDAYLSGRVVHVTPKRSVTIESECTFVQGIFGVGGERHGVIELVRAGPEATLRIEDLPVQCSGAILVGGTHPSAEVLAEAARRGAVGMVIGAIDDRALAKYLGYDLGIALTGDEKVPMTIIVTEGFGRIAMSARVYQLLSLCAGRPAAMNGATQVRAGALRPEILVPGGVEAPGLIERSGSEGLSLGSSVRIIRVPYFGKIATVVELPHELQPIETGAQTRALKARLEDGSVVLVPRANVELM